MTPDTVDQVDDLAPVKPSRWYSALARLLGFARKTDVKVPDAATEAARIESAFFASYMDNRRARS